MIKTIPRSAQTSASTVFGVRVSCGHLCEAEAPTEAAAETVSAEWLTEGEKIIRLTLLRNNPSVTASHDTSPYTGEARVCISNI